jgi:hypothetical protein
MTEKSNVHKNSSISKEVHGEIRILVSLFTQIECPDRGRGDNGAKENRISIHVDIRNRASPRKRIFAQSSRNYNLQIGSLFSLFLPIVLHIVHAKQQKKIEQLDEDSSYDSDTEIVSSPHQNVSRNVSETLAQELEDFNSVSISFFIPSSSIPDLQQNIEIVVVSSFFSSLLAHTLRRVFHIGLSSQATDNSWISPSNWATASDWCSWHWADSAIPRTMNF